MNPITRGAGERDGLLGSGRAEDPYPQCSKTVTASARTIFREGKSPIRLQPEVDQVR